ncbi:SURP and G-patch domain-containing protein 1-like protein [Acorus calamus]|uniref:SURP and G-patch domain-containing protein 1-like protein n=1 Tax=Acorus calamus TaxID=4465 RepID=A0AAV9DPD2_ACOCL|nr:SURP and G-patch domain-containing protein 1-like protein [Acorus calamus]
MQDARESHTNDESENDPPSSAWLEETLVNLYLRGYSSLERSCNNDDLPIFEEKCGVESKDTCEASHDDSSKECPCSDHEGMACEEIQEDQSSPRNIQDTPESSGRIQIHSEEGLSDEQNWLAQYGQVVPLESEGPPTFPVVDLWNWELVRQQIKKKNKKKKKKKIVSRLVGRLVNQTTKLHPSMPAGGRLLKTAHICEVHHDLVRVASGKVYKLRSPSVKYLASLSVYDSSNPTKDWGFPDFDVGKNSIESSDIDRIQGSEISDADTFCMDLPAESDQPAYILNKEKKLSYRDRAAERRSLHGGFGIGPGQKNANSIEGEESSSQSVNMEEAQAEALNMSFGTGSYARRLLEGMGWKEGEGLGSSSKGMVEPLQAVGNKGQAGLGWNNAREITGWFGMK